MTTPTYAPPLENYPRPRPLVLNKTPCRTGLFLALILLGTAVLTVDRYLTNDAVRRVEDVEAWGTRETAQIIATEASQARVMYAVRANEILAGQVRLLQQRVDEAETAGAQLMLENMTLKGFYPPAPTTGPSVIAPTDKET
jgi:hypothetical protein